MQIENTSEGQKHLAVGDESVVVPGRRDGVNGSAEASKAFIDKFKAGEGNGGYFSSGVLVVVDGPKAPPAPVKTDDEQAKANVDAVMERADKDAAALAAKDKPKK